MALEKFTCSMCEDKLACADCGQFCYRAAMCDPEPAPQPTEQFVMTGPVVWKLGTSDSTAEEPAQSMQVSDDMQKSDREKENAARVTDLVGGTLRPMPKSSQCSACANNPTCSMVGYPDGCYTSQAESDARRARAAFEVSLDAELAEIRAVLLAKNRQYGNSALEPLMVLSKASPVERIKMRIDDKIARMVLGDGSGNEDSELDTIGHFILLRMARKLA